MHRAFITVAILTGCVIPDIREITPVSDHRPSIWMTHVLRSVDTIAEIAHSCEAPFRIVSDGFEIRLIEKTRWSHGSNVGFFDHESVDIRAMENGDPPPGGILLHELGHLLGLDHVVDRPSVMNEIAAPRFMIGDAAMFAEASCR